MRCMIVVAAMFALVGCNQPSAAPAVTPEAKATALPEGFPQADLVARSAECVVYLGLSVTAQATPGGYDSPIMQQAAGQWRASMAIDGKMSETEVEQLIASSVNPLVSVAAVERDAASAWCVENAPEPDPAN